MTGLRFRASDAGRTTKNSYQAHHHRRYRVPRHPPPRVRREV